MLRIISENEKAQKSGEMTDIELTGIIKKELGISSKQDFQNTLYLALDNLILLEGGKITITSEGTKMLTSEKLLSDYWDRLNGKIVNFGMLICNIVLAIAVFFSGKGSKNIDSIRYIPWIKYEDRPPISSSLCTVRRYIKFEYFV